DLQPRSRPPDDPRPDPAHLHLGGLPDPSESGTPDGDRQRQDPGLVLEVGGPGTGQERGTDLSDRRVAARGHGCGSRVDPGIYRGVSPERPGPDPRDPFRTRDGPPHPLVCARAYCPPPRADLLPDASGGPYAP